MDDEVYSSASASCSGRSDSTQQVRLWYSGGFSSPRSCNLLLHLEVGRQVYVFKLQEGESLFDALPLNAETNHFVSVQVERVRGTPSDRLEVDHRISIIPHQDDIHPLQQLWVRQRTRQGKQIYVTYAP